MKCLPRDHQNALNHPTRLIPVRKCVSLKSDRLTTSRSPLCICERRERTKTTQERKKEGKRNFKYSTKRKSVSKGRFACDHRHTVRRHERKTLCCSSFFEEKKKNPVRCERSFCECRKAEDFDEIFLSFTQTLQGLTTLSCQKKNYGGRREKKRKRKREKNYQDKVV